MDLSISPHVSPAASFSYALIRVLPRVERGESLNVGIVLYCPALSFLGARAVLDPTRLSAFSADVEAEVVKLHLRALLAIAAGDPSGGPIAELPPSERFHWLSAPRSTLIQPAPIHSGVTTDPAGTLNALFRDLVATDDTGELTLIPEG